MKERNDNKRPKLSRKEWMKDSLSKQEKERLEEFQEADFEQKALEGRGYLEDEKAAQELLAEIDQSIAATYRERKVERRIKQEVFQFSFWHKAAAMILMLIIVGWWFWPRTTVGERLYANYFSHLDNDITVRPMGAETALDTLNEVLGPYDAQQYAEAVSALEPYLETRLFADSIWLYYGVSLLEIGRLNEAAAAFEAVREMEVSRHYIEAAHWYLALTYLKGDELIKAEDQVEMVIDSSDFYRPKAEILLEKIRAIE